MSSSWVESSSNPGPIADCAFFRKGQEIGKCILSRVRTDASRRRNGLAPGDHGGGGQGCREGALGHGGPTTGPLPGSSGAHGVRDLPGGLGRPARPRPFSARGRSPLIPQVSALSSGSASNGLDAGGTWPRGKVGPLLSILGSVA